MDGEVELHEVVDLTDDLWKGSNDVSEGIIKTFKRISNLDYQEKGILYMTLADFTENTKSYVSFICVNTYSTDLIKMESILRT